MLLPGSRSNERGAGQDAGARGDPLAPAACVAGLLGPACCALRRAVARESHDTGCSAWGCVPCACGVPRIASASLQDWPLTSVLPPLLPARPGVCQFSGQCESLALSGADGRVRLFDTGASAPRSTGSRRRRGLAALDTALDRRGRPACSNKSPAARSTPVCGAAMLFPRPGLTPAPACALPTHAAGTGRLQLQLINGGAALAVTPDAAGDAAALSCTSLTWLPVAHSGKVCHSFSPTRRPTPAWSGQHGRSSRVPLSAASPGQKQSVSDGYTPAFRPLPSTSRQNRRSASFCRAQPRFWVSAASHLCAAALNYGGHSALWHTPPSSILPSHHMVIDPQPPLQPFTEEQAESARRDWGACVRACSYRMPCVLNSTTKLTLSPPHPLSSWAPSSSAPAAAL